MESEIHNLFQDSRMDPLDNNPNNGFVPSVDSKPDDFWTEDKEIRNFKMVEIGIYTRTSLNRYIYLRMHFDGQFPPSSADPTGKKHEMKELLKLRCKKRLISLDIKFLKRCLAQKVIPNFVRKYVKFNNNCPQQKVAEKKVLEVEINKHYSKLEELDLRTYDLHLKYAGLIGNVAWENLEKHFFDYLDYQIKQKTERVNKKFDLLCSRQKKKNEVEMQDEGNNNVINLSKQNFTPVETELLEVGSADDGGNCPSKCILRSLELSLPPNNFTRADAMKNCGQWVDSQQQLQETQRSKRKRIEDVVEHCDSPVDIDEEPRSPRSTCSSTVKERPKFVQLKNEQLNLKCEWRDCDYTSTKLDPFVRHVSMHIPQLEVKTVDDEEGYVCLWESCGFETTNSKEIVRHVNFHSYHTKIKCIGTNVAARQNLPPCTYDKDGRNLLPDLPDVFTCGWEDCDQVFNNSQMYFYHVQIHVQHVTPIQNNVKSVPCSWRGCRSVFRSVYKLVDHMRTHTQEKIVGCPTCGGLFASKTKFFDHCKRQVPMELQGYQCSHCFKYYPSERLIRDHMRHHINHYKCSFCDMTCPTPSSLSQHIRYRHLDIKPFKCDFCEYTAKTQYDLKNHVTTHYSDPLYRCEEEGCNFSCRSAYGLNRHFRKFHRGDDEALYCCHICQERFHRGSLLTRHLFIKHSFRWPSGHCRFRYKHGEDGLFRLQTVRYESLEVTQEMLQSESGANEQPVCGNSRFSLRPVNSNSNNGIMFAVSENEENEDNPDDPENQPESGGRILISIEELDSSGKVVRTKVLEADEVPSIPLGSATLIQDGGEVHTESEQ